MFFQKEKRQIKDIQTEGWNNPVIHEYAGFGQGGQSIPMLLLDDSSKTLTTSKLNIFVKEFKNENSQKWQWLIEYSCFKVG